MGIATRTGVILACSILLGVAQARADTVADLVSGTCSACHGRDGRGVDADDPNIGGQKPAYLQAALRDFRDGTRPSDEMGPIAKALTDSEIAGLSAYYARQPRAPAEAADARLGPAGRRLYLARGRGGPPCAACHEDRRAGGGMMGGGMMGRMLTDPAITPRLSGQKSGYLAAQLDAFASGARKSTTMGPIARRLDHSQREAVSAYLAGLH